MSLVFLLGLIILVVELIGRYVTPFHAFGYNIPPAIIIIPIISPLRDMIQQRRRRNQAIIAMLIAAFAFYFTTKLNNAIAASAALVWVELVDFFLYTYFRRYGWLVGVVVSDVIAVPLLLPMYVFLLGFPLSVIPIHFYVVEYLSLFITYAVILTTPIGNLFTGLPMFGRRQEA